MPKTLEQAARAYCEQRERIAAIPLGHLSRPKCKRPEGIGQESCLDRYEHRSPYSKRFFEASPADQAEFCESCREVGRLVEVRHRMKASLAGLMRSMLAAYRRGDGHTQRTGD